MKVNIVRLLLIAGVATFFAFIDFSTPSVADEKCRGAHKVRTVNFKGKGEKKFKTNESVYVEGKKFEPLTNVDVYVTKNRKWKMGDKLVDKSSDGAETVQTTNKGRIPKTRVMGAPNVKGKYDVVVDANQDGTYNSGDGVFKKSKKPGFKVKVRE